MGNPVPSDERNRCGYLSGRGGARRSMLRDDWNDLVKQMEDTDIRRVCHEINRFSQKANWRWKGMPVIQWEFPDINEFVRAKMDLLQALTPIMQANMTSEAAWQRIDGPDICEIDSNGVTFRLICKQRLAVPGKARGVGAAHVVVHTYEPPRECS